MENGVDSSAAAHGADDGLHTVIAESHATQSSRRLLHTGMHE